MFDQHTLTEVGAMVLTVVGAAIVTLWRLGHTMGVIETKIDAIGEDVVTIRTNDLHHIERRFENIESVLMRGANVREDSTRDSGRNRTDQG